MSRKTRFIPIILLKHDSQLQKRESCSAGRVGGGSGVENRTFGLARSRGRPPAGNPSARRFHATVIAVKSLLGRRAIH